MTVETKPTAIEKPKAQAWEMLPKGVGQIRACLDSMRGEIVKALPKHMTVDRVLRVALTSIQSTPALLECSTISLVGCVVIASQLGLELGGPLGQAYLVPYRTKSGMIATFLPGYRGMIDLSRRTGSVAVIEARIVHRRDKFLLQQGTDAKIEHSPYIGDAEPGAMVGVYALCKMRDGVTQFEFLTKAQVDSVRKRSKSGLDGPWVTDFEEMAKKTAIRRLWKVLPVSVEKAMAKAIVAHDRAEEGRGIDGAEVFAGGDLFGTGDAPIEGAFEKTDEGKDPTKADEAAKTASTRRTTNRETTAPETGGPESEVEALRAIHEKIRTEDPVAFGAGWDCINPADVDLSKKSLDEMIAAREKANEWAAFKASKKLVAGSTAKG